ncbi:GGDEF domain-containing protein [Arenimonas terrae]|jgi:diguanylate cyclase (GGDEF)-like protein|uniref:EAL domain-containing protein n=1 Tax=Arenimonas terrae TaxID=2546226 RepID=A0A5C4RPB6_9GAMM|nr:GGDEF domain-containing protein [Arenimonas terrae]TNJ33093.1 EAL domain-containing protein [Arenimonas terrae]
MPHHPLSPGELKPTVQALPRTDDTSALAAEVQRLRVDVERLGRAERLQRALFAISDLASSDQDAATVLHGLHEIVGRLMYAENFYIVRYSPETDTMRFIYFADSLDPIKPDPTEELPASQMGNSLTLALIRHGRPVLGPSDDVRRALNVPRDETLGPDSEDWLGVPMVDEGVVRGAVVVQSYDPETRYSEDDRALLGYVAQHILTALARRDAQEELERRVDERTRELRQQIAERERSERLQAALFRIAEQAGRSESIEVFYAEVHGIVSALLDARNFFIALLTDDGRELDFPYSVDERDQKRPRRRLAKGLTEYVLASGQPLLADRDGIHDLVAEGKVQSFGTPSVCWLGVPLQIGGQPVGVIAVQSYTPDYLYTKRDQELLSFVSFHIAQALERRQANESLRLAYAELEQRVASRTSELADANRELLDQISVRERMEHKLKHEAMHDTLTGLPNRSHLLGRMGMALSRYRYDPTQLFAVLFLDLDRFKVVNDSVGHLVGDELLKEAARRIGRCVRDPDMVARLGGDEFAIVLDFIHTADDAVAVADRVISSLAEPMRIAGKELYTSASIGIALVDGRYRSPEELLRDADVAMYRAKATGRQRYALFDEHLHEAALKLLELEGDLRRALQRQEFEPHYQPIISLADGGLVGFEALMRWHHPVRGLSAPGDFIGIAEETGSLEHMDWQVYELVCRDTKRLSARNAYITLNVSPRHLRAPDFESRLLEMMARHAVKPAHLRLEVTEGALLEQPEQVQACLGRLREAGVLTLLDDFGTGYSSLSYLHRFPLHGLKIDRSFVAELRSGESGGSTAIVRAIRLLADSLGLEVIAEGIETEEQRYQLRLLGLSLGQGYLFSRPASASEILARYGMSDGGTA